MNNEADGAVITADTAWRQRLHGRNYSDKEWTTYQGLWSIYSGAGTGTLMKEPYNAIRCFRLAGDDGEKLLHKNLISVNLGFGSPVQREDGFWESNYTYSVDDATYSCSTRPHASEAGLQPHQLRRLTVATPDAYIVSPAALPPSEDAAAASSGRQGGDTSGRGRSVLPAAVWAYEAFFEDGPNRWSMGAVYRLPTGELQQTFLIREYDIRLDPEAQQPSTSLHIPDARPGVGDPSAAASLTAGKACRVAQMRYGADGLLRAVPHSESLQPLITSAPEGTRLTQYPDGMYAILPERLPAAGSSSGDVTFTWGGPMRGTMAYQQMQASYAADTGALISLCSAAWH